MQHAFPIRDHDIWDDLFEGWISFCPGTGLKTVVLLVKDRRQIAINLGAETLKNTKPLKKRAWKNKNIFVCDSHNWLRIQNPEFRSENLAVKENSTGSKFSGFWLLYSEFFRNLRFELGAQTPIKIPCLRFLPTAAR
jgi:hypothetical protein